MNAQLNESAAQSQTKDEFPVLFEIDPESNEATGTVMPFCSSACCTACGGEKYPGFRKAKEGTSHLSDFGYDPQCEECGGDIKSILGLSETPPKLPDVYLMVNAFNALLAADKTLSNVEVGAILDRKVLNAVSRHDPQNPGRVRSTPAEGILAAALKDIGNAADNGQPYGGTDLRGTAFSTAREIALQFSRLDTGKLAEVQFLIVREDGMYYAGRDGGGDHVWTRDHADASPYNDNKSAEGTADGIAGARVVQVGQLPQQSSKQQPAVPVKPEGVDIYYGKDAEDAVMDHLALALDYDAIGGVFGYKWVQGEPVLHDIREKMCDEYDNLCSRWLETIIVMDFDMVIVDSGSKHGAVWKFTYYPKKKFGTFVYEAELPS
ncbi:hypothetical protein ACXIVK_00010 [Paraburkholderia caledonica]|jgi:hypothetical protein